MMPIWSFRYLWDPPGTQRVGVMAHEVAQVLPAAVHLHPSGYLMVDYSMLPAETLHRIAVAEQELGVKPEHRVPQWPTHRAPLSLSGGLTHG